MNKVKKRSQSTWVYIQTIKYGALPLLLLLGVAVYVMSVPKSWFEYSQETIVVLEKDVTAIATLVNTLNQHTSAQQHSQSTSDDNALSVRQNNKSNQLLVQAIEKFYSIDSIDRTTEKWAEIDTQISDYLSANMINAANGLEQNSKNQSKSEDLAFNSNVLMTNLVSLLVSSNNFVYTEDYPSTTAYRQYSILALFLLVTTAISIIAIVFMIVRVTYKRMGGTPEVFQLMVDSLVNNEHEYDSLIIGREHSGAMGQLQEVRLKINEDRAEKRLTKQWDRDAGARTSIDTTNSISEGGSNEPSIFETYSVEASKSESVSELPGLDKTTTVNSTTAEPSASDNAETAELLALRALKTSNDRRIKSLLETAKSEASPELANKCDVNDDDDIGRIAYWQKINIETLLNAQKKFSTQSESLLKSSLFLTDINSTMNQSSERTTEQALAVSNSVEEISQNVGSVALAVKEMSASIREISEHTAEAAQVSEHAVVLAKDTDTTVRKLSESSTDIGAVIKVINSIAEQTNLLALNATIEAARAGDAGKGFAVVANEVKELAKETARATQEIGNQIATIQSDSNDAVTVIGDIRSIIDRVNEIQSTIAAAVEEQSVTTTDINRSISDVSQGSLKIAENVLSVADMARENQESVKSANNALDTIMKVSNEFGHLVESFCSSDQRVVKKAA